MILKKIKLTYLECTVGPGLWRCLTSCAISPLEQVQQVWRCARSQEKSCSHWLLMVTIYLSFLSHFKFFCQE